MSAELSEVRTDVMKAKAIREELGPLLDQVCAVLNRARGEGLVVSFGLGMDGYGRSKVQDLSVVRPL